MHKEQVNIISWQDPAWIAQLVAHLLGIMTWKIMGSNPGKGVRFYTVDCVES